MYSKMWWKDDSYVLSVSQSRAHPLVCWMRRLLNSKKTLVETLWRLEESAETVLEK